MKKDIIIVGVGGQGILLASRVLGRLAMDVGLDIKVSEVHGMSQRGGDVITHVRVGEKVLSPLVTEGEADAILSFELMEAARALPFLREGGRIVVNSQKIEPVTVKIGAAEYPEGIDALLRSRGRVLEFDARAVAAECDAPKSVNIALLGAFAAGESFTQEAWLAAVEACVPPKTIEANRRAFLAGWQRGEKA